MFVIDELFARVFGPHRTRRAARPAPRARASAGLRLEELEARELLAGDWFSTYIANPAVANLLRNDWAGHRSVTRGDLLAVFSQVERDGRVDPSELDSLRFLARYGNLLNMAAPVQSLLGEVVSTSDSADLHYQGGALGYLGANDPASKLQKLVNKWFLGADHPALAAGTAGTYTAVSGSLFGPGGPKYTDIYQQALGDCTYLAALAETAARTGTINSMFTANGDNTWTVRLYRHGSPVYVTVDNQLPNGGNLYDRPSGGVLWAALAEKAVAQVNEEGWLATVQPGVNSYNALNNGNQGTAVTALALFSGRPTSGIAISTNGANVAQDMAAGKLVVLGTGDRTGLATIEHNHAYAVVDYNASASQPFTIFNPWGINGGKDGNQPIWGRFTASGAAVKAYFSYAVQTGAAPEARTVVQASGPWSGPWDGDRCSSPVPQTGSPQTPAAGHPVSQPAGVLAAAPQSRGRLSDLAGSPARPHRHTAPPVDRPLVEFDTL
jgi:hypothetical protein